MRGRALLILIALTVYLSFPSCSSREALVQNTYTVYDLKRGNYVEDSSFVYSLPYAKSKKYRLVQAYHAKHLSHQNVFALDFKMPTGSAIHAAREGVVIQVKENSNIGGLGDEYYGQGNNIIIEHKDHTFSGYWHLKKEGAAVVLGQNVKQGMLIGYSGNTGYSAFPHLHFFVFTRKNGIRESLPSRFDTNKGVRYLKPGMKYTSK
jgi:murein DD-endopeptidase MepM/ murein hydrolase activator NlpD